MTECDLCKYFGGTIAISDIDMSTLDDECITWIARIFGVRRKYLDLMKDMSNY